MSVSECDNWVDTDDECDKDNIRVHPCHHPHPTPCHSASHCCSSCSNQHHQDSSCGGISCPIQQRLPDGNCCSGQWRQQRWRKQILPPTPSPTPGQTQRAAPQASCHSGDSCRKWRQQSDLGCVWRGRSPDPSPDLDLKRRRQADHTG